MRIPQQLPQFKSEQTLIIVAGKQDAIFYKTENGFLEKIDIFKIPKPHYSDNEGYFIRRGRGVVMSSGAPRELDDRDIIRDFIHELKTRFKKIIFTPTKIYLFAPGRTKNVIRGALPAYWKKKLVSVVDGNYFYRHPLYFLRKIDEIEIKKKNRIGERLVPEPEAERILEISRQARTVIRGRP